MKKYVLLSFDVEEFDMPLEYKQDISIDEQMDVGIRGLEALMPILSNTSIPTTLFTTANFAIAWQQQSPSSSRQNHSSQTPVQIPTGNCTFSNKPKTTKKPAGTKSPDHTTKRGAREKITRVMNMSKRPKAR